MGAVPRWFPVAGALAYTDWRLADDRLQSCDESDVGDCVS